MSDWVLHLSQNFNGKDAQAVDKSCALGSDMMQISPGLGYHGAPGANDLPSLCLYAAMLELASVGRDF